MWWEILPPMVIMCGVGYMSPVLMSLTNRAAYGRVSSAIQRKFN